MKHVLIKKIFLILVIILIVVVVFRSSVTEPFDIDLDKVRYGNITEEHKLIVGRKIISFMLPLPLNTLSLPPQNSSEETKKELDYLSKLKPLTSKNFNANVYQTYLTFAGENGLVYDEKHLKKLSNDIDTFVINMKYIYNRPRPHQLAFIYQMNMNSKPDINVSTPSYPALSTLKSRLLSDVLIYNNPNYKKKLNAMAKQIEISRLFNGHNYPSDNEAALKIANILKNRIKYLEI